MIVLYVSRDIQDPEMMCPGSIVCLAMIEKIEENLINIQDCDVLRKSKVLPDWLNGTPILVDDERGVPYRGKDAIKQLRILQKQHPQRKKSKATEENKNSTDLNDLNSDFQMDVKPIQETSNGKITEQDLQRFMEARNSSPAGQNAKAAAANVQV